MRIWFSGPRILGVRPGVSFGPEDFRSRQATRRAQPQGTAASSQVSFVYVIAGENGLTKIGISTNPSARLAQLQTASPFPLSIHYLAATDPQFAVGIEAEAHSMLSRNRMEGEWFDAPVEFAVAAVGTAAHRLGAPIVVMPKDGTGSVQIPPMAQVADVTTPPQDRPKTPKAAWLAYLVFIPFFWMGAHRFYLGMWASGFAVFATFVGIIVYAGHNADRAAQFSLLWIAFLIVDLFRMPSLTNKANIRRGSVPSEGAPSNENVPANIGG